MTNNSASSYIQVTLAVMVFVDPCDEELLDRYDRTKGRFSVANVVRAEIESNLESVSYVRRVSVQHVKGGETC